MFVSLFDNGHSGLFDDSANSGALFIEENDQLFLFGEILRFRAFLLKVYSKGGDSSRTCYGATIFG